MTKQIIFIKPDIWGETVLKSEYWKDPTYHPSLFGFNQKTIKNNILLIGKVIKKKNKHELRNGILYLKGGDLTEDTSVNLYDTVGATGRNLKVTYGASDISLLVLDNSGSFTLGGNASTFGSTSVAIGANAVANREKSVSIGSGAGNTTPFNCIFKLLK